MIYTHRSYLKTRCLVIRQTDRPLVFMFDPVKIFLTSSLINMHNLVVVVSHCVRACRRSSKFGRSALKDVGI